jgi:hypothetical protein
MQQRRRLNKMAPAGASAQPICCAGAEIGNVRPFKDIISLTIFFTDPTILKAGMETFPKRTESKGYKWLHGSESLAGAARWNGLTIK